MLAEYSNELLSAVAAAAAFNGGIGLWVLKTLSAMNTRLSRLEGRLAVRGESDEGQ